MNLADSEVVGLLMSLAITESLNPPFMRGNVASARQKIACAFPEQQRESIQRLRSRVLIGCGASAEVLATHTESNPAAIEALTNAFFKQRQLDIGYCDGAGECTERRVEPQCILLNWPVWYLSSWDQLRQAPRLFRFDRFLYAQMQPGEFALRSTRTLMKGYETYFQAV